MLAFRKYLSTSGSFGSYLAMYIEGFESLTPSMHIVLDQRTSLMVEHDGHGLKARDVMTDSISLW